MKNTNNAMLATMALLLSTALLLPACSNGGSDGKPYYKADSLTVTSYNVGLAPNFVPYTGERLAPNEALLADYSSDVLCLQEVWLDE